MVLSFTTNMGDKIIHSCGQPHEYINRAAAVLLLNFAVTELNSCDKGGERERFECQCPCKHEVHPRLPAMGAGAGSGWSPAVLDGASSRAQLM